MNLPATPGDMFSWCTSTNPLQIVHSLSDAKYPNENCIGLECLDMSSRLLPNFTNSFQCGGDDVSTPCLDVFTVTTLQSTVLQFPPWWRNSTYYKLTGQDGCTTGSEPICNPITFVVFGTFDGRIVCKRPLNRRLI